MVWCWWWVVAGAGGVGGCHGGVGGAGAGFNGGEGGGVVGGYMVGLVKRVNRICSSAEDFLYVAVIELFY